MKFVLPLSLFSMIIMSTLTKCKRETTIVHDTTTITHIDTLTVTKTDTLIKTLALQPGPDEGQNCITGDDLFTFTNLNNNPDIYAGTWTYHELGGGTAVTRTYLKFIGLDGMPDSAIILSAKLSLYGISSGVAAPQGNSTYPGSPYSDNSSWLKRATADWDPDSLLWDNKPATTDVNEVAIGPSNSRWDYDAIDIDVTHLVDDMLNTENFGFCLQLQTEQIFRTISFASCKVADPTKRPKLVVTYKLIK